MVKKAFTLAETLIVILIIGVVAALTIPSVVAKYRERALVTRLVKVYGSIQQMYQLAVQENEDYTLTAPNNKLLPQKDRSLIVAKSFQKYMNSMRICGVDINKGCFSENRYKTIAGVYETSNGNNYGWIDKDQDIAKTLLADGSSMYFKGVYFLNGAKSGCTDTGKKLNGASYKVCGWVTVDLNGQEKPNQYGIDLFEFEILEPPNGIVPGGRRGETTNNKDSMTENCNLTKNTKSSVNGRYCTAWVLEKRNMDYLRCKGLTWTNSKCAK